MIDEFDLDQDGEINEAEFLAIMMDGEWWDGDWVVRGLGGSAAGNREAFLGGRWIESILGGDDLSVYITYLRPTP